MVNNNTNEDENFVMALVGNKCDIDDGQKRVSYQTSKDLAAKHNMIHSETSAKTGDGIQSMFKKVAERIALIKLKAANQE